MESTEQNVHPARGNERGATPSMRFPPASAAASACAWNPLRRIGVAAQPTHPISGDSRSCTYRSAADLAHDQFVGYVKNPDFPCIGARSALNRDRYRFRLFGALGDAQESPALCSALYDFLHEFQAPGLDPVSFVAAFETGAGSEAQFEALLWQQLQSMHRVDRRFFGWDRTVDCDPATQDFSFSIGGRALFVVGLHPRASRLARRAPAATLVFNLHAQFQALRGSGKYAGMQAAVRKRDIALQGSINPVLAAYGDASEARQYAGRAVGDDWRCPFEAGAST